MKVVKCSRCRHVVEKIPCAHWHYKLKGTIFGTLRSIEAEEKKSKLKNVILFFQVHNTCCFLPPPPPPPSTSLSKNSLHKHFSLSSDVLAENTAPGEMRGGDLSESYPAHLNHGGRCPYHQQHRHKSHCWQNHCCVMSTNLQHCAEEPQPGGGGNYAYPRRPHSSLEADSNSVSVPVGGLRKPEQCSDRYSQNHGLLPGSSAEVVFDGASSTTTLLRSHHHPVKKSLCQNSQTFS